MGMEMEMGTKIKENTMKQLSKFRLIIALALGLGLGLLSPTMACTATTATLAPQVKFRAMDSNGDPYVGGKLYTYETGTTTLKTSWTDSTKVTPNTNPVVLDNRGQADVWIDSSSGAYRFKLDSSDDVTIWTKDGISNVASGGSYSTMTLPVKEDSLITYDDSASGTKKLAIHDLLGNVHYPDYNETDQGVAGSGSSVKVFVDAISTDSATLVFRHNSGSAATTYTFSTDETIPSNIKVVIEKGAILSIAGTKTLTINGSFSAGLYQVFSGDGSVAFRNGAIKYTIPQWWGTDAPTSIQAAIDTALPTTGAVFIPSGSYYMGTTGLTITDSIKVYGTSNTKLLWDEDFVDTGITITGTNVHLEDLLLWHANSDIVHNATGISAAIHGTFLKNVKVQGYGVGTYEGWSKAIFYDEWTHVAIGCTFTGEGYGVAANSSVNALRLTDCYINANPGAGAGVFIVGGHAISIKGCDIEGNSDYGVHLTSTDGNVITGVDISGCYFENQQEANIRIGGFSAAQPNRGISITGNMLENNGHGGRNILSEYTEGLSITGNELHGAYTDAILLQLSNLNANVSGNAYDTGTTLVVTGAFSGIKETKNIIQGDDTAGRVLRASVILIADGTNAATIKASVSSIWNGDIIAEEDNLAKLGDTGNFSLDDAGDRIEIEGGFTGNIVEVLTSDVIINTSGTALICNSSRSGTKLRLTFRSAIGAVIDLTTLVDTGHIYLRFLYLTDE